MLLLAGCLLAVGLACAAPAGAVVKVEKGTVVGLQPRNETTLFDGPLAFNELLGETELTSPNEFANTLGNPVVHGSAVYAVYWDPTYHYHDDWKEKIDEFLQKLGGASSSLNDFMAVDTQYTDKTNKPAYNRVTFRGAAEDTEAYPVSGCTDPHPIKEKKVLHTYPLGCLTDQQMREQLQHFIALHGLPTGLNTIYYLLTPPGLTVCLNGGGAAGHCSDFSASKEEEEEGFFESSSYKTSFCSYHSDYNPGQLSTGDGNTILYSVIPWTAGGFHDGDFLEADQKQADNCQDGRFNQEPGKGWEKAPVQQEPNQPAACPSVIGDGFCDTGLVDVIINQIAEEQENTTTNPLLNAWQDPLGNEATDECRNFMGPVKGSYGAVPATGAGTLYNQTIGEGKYYINDAFNLSALRLTYPGIPCIGGVNLQPKFTAPNPVNAGDIVSFDGMESNITLNSAYSYNSSGSPAENYATYKWSFGDGSPEVTGYAPGAPVCSEPWLSPCAASVFHAYAYGGQYTVTLTVTDVGGNTESTSQNVTVIGPPPPSPSPSPSPSPGGSTTGSTATGTTTATPGSTPAASHPEAVPAPVATAVIVSRSLKSTLGKAGLVVRYAVNEQVAGRFEVLLPSSTARKLGITGPAAAATAAGAAPQVVIAKAILVTTKGGSNIVHIQFSKRTVARLRRLRSLTLTLRLSVRNAASHVPTSTTVLASTKLSH
ncbi:MAG TPA: PKD domain-containing protein [Solirubrobacteraceae bacterium]|nr:PKD domain-containing protein [Solirubrobacteraceae bacterium]